ncbi:MAG: bifunctional adenosylcobinamide kinase/adenosylcobinamide-phosphate guanylyltransferase [Candidatus Obscuribacterales bacterium]|nr:bifunctional adenosylcobinamide kinase/adenosylcobinamide-phosphate guanylyltransferase [Candidatus Obscuribacterales bacterium]
MSNAATPAIQKESLENLVVITGGARSGKSSFAEELALQSGHQVCYLATMPNVPNDAELAHKVVLHQARRPTSWQTIEKELDIHTEFEKLPDGPGTCLIDCLSLYVSNIMLEGEDGPDEILKRTATKVTEALSQLTAGMTKRSDWTFIVVTNEVGWSVVPDNKMARAFRDLLGDANQFMAQAAWTVYLACSGLKIKLKENGKCKLE